MAKYLFLQGTPVQLHSPAHGLDHGKVPPTQMGLSWMDQRKVGEYWLDRLVHLPVSFLQTVICFHCNHDKWCWGLIGVSHKRVSLIKLCLFLGFPNVSAGGPYPMIKQEQLSPRSLSSQPDNLSTQGAPHDSAAGRGGWLIFYYHTLYSAIPTYFKSWLFPRVFINACKDNVRVTSGQVTKHTRLDLNLIWKSVGSWAREAHLIWRSLRGCEEWERLFKAVSHVDSKL